MNADAAERTLFAYHFHITQRLLGCASRLSDADYTAQPGYGRGSIHDLFVHLLTADQAWRIALETGTQPPRLTLSIPDLAAVRAGFAAAQSSWETLLAGLDDGAGAAILQLKTLRGDLFPIARWRVLQHLILHGMQHHTEIAQLLTAKGQSPGDIDFIFYNG